MTEKFTAEERSAMREAAKERKLALNRSESLAATLARIESMTPQDRALALELHNLAMKVYPDFEVKTWYGMPAYCIDGKVVLFFQDGDKFKTRYCTVGFQESAKLDEGTFWPNAYALTKLTPAVGKEISELIKRAVGVK
ncbi:MAG: DUF1801 domain-containing protein [Rhodoluna sp.]|nr:DUF1801 domain-containing protein [Rhodoluna sp.]